MLVLTKGLRVIRKKHRRSWSSWKRQKSNVVSKILGFRIGIKSHTTDSRLPDLLVRVCGVMVQLPGSRRLCWAWCSSNCPDQRWLLVAWGSQIRGNATIPYRSLTKAHLDIHLDGSNYNIHFVKIKRMINRQTKHIPIVFQILNLHCSHGVLCASEKGAFIPGSRYRSFAIFLKFSIQRWLHGQIFGADYILMTAICIVLLQSSHSNHPFWKHAEERDI